MAEFNTEGLNSLKYEVESIEKTVLYTRVLVELKTETVGVHTAMHPLIQFKTVGFCFSFPLSNAILWPFLCFGLIFVQLMNALAAFFTKIQLS